MLFVTDQIPVHKIFLKKLLSYKLYKCCFSIEYSIHVIIYIQNLNTTNPSLNLSATQH